ncbi:MAG: glycosyltransferase [bacterium]|nr:glycosyltransferase [bacterium]
MVSFIIPTHNSREYVGKCIDSITVAAGVPLCNSIPKDIFEIIVIDDASTDGTSDFIRKNYPGVKCFCVSERSGAAYARNLGIVNSCGNILVFVDADVWLDKECINEFLTQINRYNIVYTVPYFPNGIPIFPIFAAKYYPVISAIFMMKREALGKLDKYFDEKYEIYNEDLDFFLRCKIAGLTARYTEKAKAYHWLKDSKNAEFRYYMDLRNSIYAYLKFYKLGKSIVGFPSIKIILQNIGDFLWNKNAYSKLYFEPASSGFLKIWYKISPRAKITQKTRFYIVYMIFKAFMWNVRRLREIKGEYYYFKTFLSNLKLANGN